MVNEPEMYTPYHSLGLMNTPRLPIKVLSSRAWKYNTYFPPVWGIMSTWGAKENIAEHAVWTCLSAADLSYRRDRGPWRLHEAPFSERKYCAVFSHPAASDLLDVPKKKSSRQRALGRSSFLDEFGRLGQSARVPLSRTKKSNRRTWGCEPRGVPIVRESLDYHSSPTGNMQISVLAPGHIT